MRGKKITNKIITNPHEHKHADIKIHAIIFAYENFSREGSYI